MEQQYGMADLRQYMDGRQLFPAMPPPPIEVLSGHRSLTAAQHYEMVIMGRHHQVGDMNMMTSCGVPQHRDQFRTDSAAIASTTTSATGASANAGLNGGLEMEAGIGLGGGDAGTGRWPRQETLTLLEIRSRLDSKFKEANQKGPLWDEVSGIMSEEHGYQRSGKKCREKFENLYKYYKKTKEGKAGRQDGKNYRFFRQLEALCGETSNPNSVSEENLVGHSFRYNMATNNVQQQPNQEEFQVSKLTDSLTFSNSSGFDTSSSDEIDYLNDDSTEKRKKRSGKRSWKAKLKDIVGSQMRKLIEKQEAWLEKMMKTIEHKEEERMLREEAWRKQETARIDRKHKLWAHERAWIEARDATLMEALQKLTGKELKPSSDAEELMVAEFRSFSENQTDNGSETITNSAKSDSWSEGEITRLVELRSSVENRFQQNEFSEEVLWEEIAAKMTYLGYDRTPVMCKDKWNSINSYLTKNKEFGKKARQNSRNYYCLNNNELCSQGGAYFETNDHQGLGSNDHAASPPNTNTGNGIHDSCFRLLMGDPENLWQNYGMKLGKGENH